MTITIILSQVCLIYFAITLICVKDKLQQYCLTGLLNLLHRFCLQFSLHAYTHTPTHKCCLHVLKGGLIFMSIANFNNHFFYAIIIFRFNESFSEVLSTVLAGHFWLVFVFYGCITVVLSLSTNKFNTGKYEKLLGDQILHLLSWLIPLSFCKTVYQSFLLFIYSSIRSFFHSYIHSFILSFLRSFIQLSIT